eukprot:31314-Pelagococcus_subviridis.AAC.7
MWNDTEYESSALSRVASATRTVTLPRPRAFGTSTRSEYVPGVSNVAATRREKFGAVIDTTTAYGPYLYTAGVLAFRPPRPRPSRTSTISNATSIAFPRTSWYPRSNARTPYHPALATMLFPACTCDGHAFIGSYGEFKLSYAYTTPFMDAMIRSFFPSPVRSSRRGIAYDVSPTSITSTHARAPSMTYTYPSNEFTTRDRPPGEPRARAGSDADADPNFASSTGDITRPLV